MHRLVAERFGDMAESLVLYVVIGNVQQLKVIVVLQDIADVKGIVMAQFVVGQTEFFKDFILLQSTA